MQRAFFILFLSFFSFVFSQSYSLEQVENTSDIRIIAAFVKENPTHPKVPELKRKMATLMGGSGSTYTPSTTPTPKYSTTSKPYNRAENQQTAEVLTHIFNNDPYKKEAYVSLINQSKCPIEITLTGRKTYKISIAANRSNFILLDKGIYSLTTNVCGTPYSSQKNLMKDMEITLHN